MDSLPVLPGCSLDQPGLRAQRERYRQVADGARVERGRDRIVVAPAPRVDGAVVEELIAVERECCPFFALDWDRQARLLTVAVSRPEHEPALDAIELALRQA